MKAVDLSGRKFGKLTVIKPVGKNKSGNTLWLCRCECGGETIAINSNLTRGNTQSCGCTNRERIIAKNTKYQHSNSPIYNIWRGMQERCYTKTSRIYKYYGGKGITVCKEWHDYENFYSWAINFGYEKGLTIERNNYDGNYEPFNCRWATMLEQANNKSNTLFVTIDGIRVSLADTCRRYGVNYKNTWKRLHKGWTLNRALFS